MRQLSYLSVMICVVCGSYDSLDLYQLHQCSYVSSGCGNQKLVELYHPLESLFKVSKD